ncbi:SUKH-4 family immunity protein [Streptomyces sp. NPDC049597]|uniref:SUKH-4 family immunity protein n=1 Tax=Streptomyces sp. NPDC049597 TaxID=3155276 RepID=UPI0034428E1E
MGRPWSRTGPVGQRPAGTDCLSLVNALARFLSAVDDFTALRGDFADLVGRTGPVVVEEATARLLSVFTDEEWGDGGWGAAGDPQEWDHAVPAFWRIAALIRPLALIAAPGDGLRLDLPKGLLDEEFGPGEVVRMAPADLPAALEHEPTRRFLTEVGLPQDGLMFELWRDDYLLQTLPEREETGEDGGERLPAGAEWLVCLGSLVHDFEALIDGRTGQVHYREYHSDTVTPVNADISTLAFTVWMHSREQTLDKEHDFTDDFYACLADTMAAALASVDPVACLPAAGPDDYRYWPEVFHDEAGGVL